MSRCRKVLKRGIEMAKDIVYGLSVVVQTRYSVDFYTEEKNVCLSNR